MVELPVAVASAAFVVAIAAAVAGARFRCCTTWAAPALRAFAGRIASIRQH